MKNLNRRFYFIVLLTNIFLCIAILTGCVSTNDPVSSDDHSDTNFVPSTESTEETTAENINNICDDHDLPKRYNSLAKFYAFAERNETYYPLERKAFVKLEQLGLQNQEFLDSIYQITLFPPSQGNNTYTEYMFSTIEHEMTIGISYQPQKYTANDARLEALSNDGATIDSGGLTACLDATASNDIYYAEEIDDCIVCYHKQLHPSGSTHQYYTLYIVVDGLAFIIHSSPVSEDWINNPQTSELNSFFREDTHVKAIQTAITGIKNRNNQS